MQSVSQIVSQIVWAPFGLPQYIQINIGLPERKAIGVTL